MDNCSIKFFQD